MYVLSGEALHMNEANATAVVLLLVVLLMNTPFRSGSEKADQEVNGE